MVGLISEPHVVTFSSDELPPAGTSHNRPLYVTVQHKEFRIPLMLVGNGAGLNVCPLRTASELGFKVDDITPATKGMTAFDNTRHDALGVLVIPLTIG